MSLEFGVFCEYAEKIEQESKTTKITEIIQNLMQESGDDLGETTRFIQGRVFPEWDARKTEVGPSLMRRALAESTSETEDSIEEKVASMGDIGEVAASLSYSGGQQTLASKSLTVGGIAEALDEIANMSGSGSQQRKIDKIIELLVHASPVEAKYISRLVLEELRIGVGEGLVRDAIAGAFNVPVSDVEWGIMVTNNTGNVAETARDEGKDGLNKLDVEIGRPLKPMLAQKGEITDGIDGWGKVVSEVKYDGARLQIHKDDDEIKLFTRGYEDVTDSLPDVVTIARENINAESAILDAEVVAYPPDDKTDPLPFREIMKRLGRKYDVEETKDQIAVDVKVFDLLYYNGNTVLTDTARNRWTLLDSICPDILASHRILDNERDVQEHEAEALANGHEGLMLKNPDAEYSPGKRGQDWLKIKPDVETLDCVVVGGEMGEGRRANVIGSYMLAVRGEDGNLQKIGKVATGITDERLEELTELFDDLIVKQDGQDLTIHPEIVFEVGYEDIQPSPKYSSGYALRFPRFLGVRTDKDVSSADSVEKVERLVD